MSMPVPAPLSALSLSDEIDDLYGSLRVQKTMTLIAAATCFVLGVLIGLWL